MTSHTQTQHTILYVGPVSGPDGDLPQRLEQAGDRIEVQVAATAEAALDRLRTARIDCLVSRYQLPDADGIDLFRQVDRTAAAGAVPFVLFTDAGSEAVAAEALNAGVSGYVRADSPDSCERLAGRVSEELAARPGNRFDTLAEALGDPVYVLDGDGQFVYVNEAFEALTGYDRAEILGSHPSLIKDETTVATAERHLGRLLSADGPDSVTFEADIQTSDGETVTCEDNMGVLPYEGDQFRGSLGVLRDITERTERKRATERARDELEAVIEAVPHPLYVLDADNYEIQQANSLATTQEVHTIHGRDESSDTTRSRLLEEVLETGEPATAEHVHEDESGNERVFRVEASPIVGEDGTVTKVVETNIEITGQVEYEKRLETQRDNLDVLNQVLRHDIRNDLQLVTVYADMLADHVEPGDAREYVQTVRESAQHAVELTRTARDMAEVMLGTEDGRQLVDLRSTLESELDEISSQHDKAVVTVDGTLPAVTVHADDMLPSVFRNLLQNAIQHNDTGAPEVTVSATHHDDRVVVRIADNGPGIPDDRKDEIFGRGQKGLDSAGTGLGLYLVRTLVERYGGDVWVEDRADRLQSAGSRENDTAVGAVFVVALPKAEETVRH